MHDEPRWNGGHARAPVRQLAPEVSGPQPVIDEPSLGWSLRFPELSRERAGRDSQTEVSS
ncbi:hypothetical protein ACIQVO_36330 [Streptomyces sp. NPDC101062]|uniref:hypothetical protein n=1 Tax=unclassified Streptomyces TaxID=2593676 RepID=UPI00381C4D90